MADVVLFPGTEMEVNEKYPDSRRLDHPDFADVAKTTFAKGTITDFKKVSDDPITVESMVKVTGDFGGSDYIPIFYHPKAQYWDDESVMAQDYDEELGCFKQAWMSFRVDDEVAVMLKEGVPVAVLGFADGVPRIGENIFKFDIGGGYCFEATKRIPYADGDNGPDGKPLNLLRECTVITGDLKVTTIEIECNGKAEWSVAGYTEKVWHEAWLWPTPAFEQCIAKGAGVWTSYGAKCDVEYHHHDLFFLCPVGPILYLIPLAKVNQYNRYSQPRYYVSDVVPFTEVYDSCSSITCSIWPDLGQVAHPECEAEMEALAASKTGTETGGYVSPDSELGWMVLLPNGHGWPYLVYAAVYSDKLYDDALEMKSLDDLPDEFVEQSHFLLNSSLGTEIRLNGEVDWSMFVRPHTKEELQEAGMWPV